MQGVELFSVLGKLVLDKSGFDSDVQQADESGKNLAEKLTSYMEKAKKVIKGVFAAVAVKKAASFIWDLANNTATAGDRIDKTSQALGMSRKAFQEWDYILSQSGASIDSMGMTMKTLTAAISENSAETAAGLSKLGLSAAQLQSMSAEEQFETLVKAFQEMPEGVEKSQLAMQLFGRGAQSLMPLLNSASGTVDDLRQRAHDLGLIMSDEDVDASVAFGDALADLQSAWTAIQQKFGAQMLPTFTKGLIAAANALGRISNAVSDAFATGDWSGVFSTITEEIKNLLPGLIDTILDVVNGIFDKADEIVDLAVSIITGLGEGLIRAAPKLVAKLPQIFRSIVNGVKSLFKTLFSTIFGTNADGGIKWPTWDDVKAAATKAWREIKEGLAGLASTVGKWVFGERDDGSVNWPSWEDVSAAAQQAWQSIRDGLSGLVTSVGKFIFGERDDGSVDWPTWDEVGEAARTAVGTIINGLGSLLTELGKFVFGERDDGSVDWPDWNDVKEAAEKAWNGIKKGLAGLVTMLGAFVFGKRDDGAIDWPTWDKIKQTAVDAWNGIKTGLANLVVELGKWVFGDDNPEGLSWLDEIKSWIDGTKLLQFTVNIGAKVSEWIERIWGWIKNGINITANFLGLGPKEYDGPNKDRDFGGANRTNGGAGIGDVKPMIYAKGLNYVPFDNYPTLLHRGEAVLNQSQGREWRQGGSGFNTRELYEAVASAVASAVSNISIDMDGKAVGNAVTEQVSRNIYRSQMGRRVGVI